MIVRRREREKVQRTRAGVVKRVCLGCGRRFGSQGVGNRFCGDCQKLLDGRSEGFVVRVGGGFIENGVAGFLSSNYFPE